MRIILVALAAVILPAGAHAATVLNDTFDGEDNGATQTNYDGFANFNVTGNSTVDLIATGNIYGLKCVTGSCVDLGGSASILPTKNDMGTLTSKQSYSFNAGDKVTLTFALSGNQRPRDDAEDALVFSAMFGGNTVVTSSSYTVEYGNGSIASGSLGSGTTTGLTRNFTLGANAPYFTDTVSFTAGSAGTLQFSIGDADNDDYGAMLDNVRLDIDPAAVPEPASWAMMIGGFGLIGGTLRRRGALSFA